MKKIIIPHIHKIEGEAGFWAEVTKKGEVKKLKIKTLEGLRQIEGILIGRRFGDVPIIISRVCGICPVVHQLNACQALEKALEIKVSSQTILLRKLLLIGQMIESHSLHLFFLSLADFFNIDNDLDLLKKFPKETKSALSVREFSLELIKIIGGRVVHPLTPKIGGFRKLPKKQQLIKILGKLEKVLKSAEILVKLFQNLEYPQLKRKTIFVSLGSKKEYPFYQSDYLLAKDKKISAGDFYSNQIEEDLKIPPVKKVKFKGQPYMVGAIARVYNNHRFLNPLAKSYFKKFQKEQREIFNNSFYNLFFQAIEILHFLEEAEKIIKKLLKINLPKEEKKIKINKGSGLATIEAPRGTLFTYFELDEEGRVFDCNIITPSAQFLNNLEKDLKIYLTKIFNLPQKERTRKIRALIRAYDPCISCATH